MCDFTIVKNIPKKLFNFTTILFNFMLHGQIRKIFYTIMELLRISLKVLFNFRVMYINFDHF